MKYIYKNLALNNIYANTQRWERGVPAGLDGQTSNIVEVALRNDRSKSLEGVLEINWSKHAFYQSRNRGSDNLTCLS